eukprot:scpid30212/ scgid26861/ 
MWNGHASTAGQHLSLWYINIVFAIDLARHIKISLGNSAGQAPILFGRNGQQLSLLCINIVFATYLAPWHGLSKLPSAIQSAKLGSDAGEIVQLCSMYKPYF